MAIATSTTTNELDNIKIDENNDQNKNISNNCCINSSDTTSNIIITKINKKNKYTTKSIGNNTITSCISNNSNNNSCNNSSCSSDSVNCINNKNTIKHKTKSHETKSFVADRIQNWNRAIPEEGYITLGTIRYGVRLSTGSNPINFPTEKFSISTGTSTSASSSTSCSRSLPPTPYLNRSNILKGRRASEQNQLTNIKQNSDNTNSIISNKSINSNLNCKNINNNSKSNSNSNCDNNSNISNKENNSSDSKTSSILRCESDRSTTSSNYCKTSCCSYLNKTSIAIPCWNKNLCNRNNAPCCNSICPKKKYNTKGSDISLDTFSSRSANYRLQARTTKPTTTATETKLSTKKTQFPSTSSFSSSISTTDLSPSITIPFSRTATVMSAPKINFLASSNILLAPNPTTTTATATTTSTIPIAKTETIITTSAQIHDAIPPIFNNPIKIEQIENNNHNNDEDDTDNAPIPPIRTTSQIQYLKTFENNNSNGSIYNNGNIHINSNNNNSNNNNSSSSSSGSNNNTLSKISRLKYYGQKLNETNKNLTKIPTAIGNSHSDYNSINIISSLSSSVSSTVASTSTQSLLSSSLPTTLSYSTGSVTTTRISTKISPITTTTPIQLHHKINPINQENYKNSIHTKNDNNILNQQQQREQQIIQKNSQNINGNSQCFYQENQMKMCQTPGCSCSNINNSVVKNSNDHVYSHHEIKNTTNEHQQQQHYENEFGQNSRDKIENSSLSSVLAETRSCKFNKKILSSSSQKSIREENRELNSTYPLQNSRSLPIATSSLAKYQNQENYNYNKNYNENLNKNNTNENNNFKNDFIIQQKNEKNDNDLKNLKCCHTNNNNINKNDNKTNINLKNKNEQNILLKNTNSNINCCSTINCSCSNNNSNNNNNNNTNQIPHQNNQNHYLPQPHKLYTGGSIPRAIIQQTLDTVVQRSLGIDRKNSESNGYDKINKIKIPSANAEPTNGYNTLRQRRLSPPPPVPPKPNRHHHQQVVRSKSVDSNVNNYQNTNFDTLIENSQQQQQQNNNQICDSNYNNSDSTTTATYDPSKFRRKLLKFEQKNFLIKKSPSAGLDLLNCFTKSNTTDDLNIVNPKRKCESSNDLVNRNNYINIANNNKNLYENDKNHFNSSNINTINKFKNFKSEINNDTSSSTSLSSSDLKLYSNTTPSLVIRKLTPKLTRKTLNFGNSNSTSNDFNTNLTNVNYKQHRSVSEDRLIDDNSSDNNDLNSYCDSLGSVNDPIIESPTQNLDSNFLIYGEPIPIVPIQTKAIILNKNCTIITPQIKIKSSLTESQSNDDIGFIDSSEKEDSDSFDLIKNDNTNSKYITNILDYPKSITIYKNTHYKSEYDSNTKLLHINKENDKTEIINETNNNTINNNNNNNNSNENNNNNKINDLTNSSIINNDRIIFKDLYDSLSDSLETSTISCLSETTTTTTTTTDLLTNINCGCRFQICNEIANSNDSNDSCHNNSNNNNDNGNVNNNITSDIDLCLLNNINENGIKKSSDLCCCNERVKRFCKELKNQEFNHIKHNNNKNKNNDNNNDNNDDNNTKQLKIFKSNSDNFIKNKEFINKFLVNHLNNNNSNSENLNNKIINNKNSILLDDNNKNLNDIKNNLSDSIITITPTTTTTDNNSNTPPITISPTNSLLIGLPPLPPPLPPIQFRNNTNSYNSNYSSCSSDSKIHRYDWNSELSDLNSISGNSNSSDSNSIHSNHSNTSSSNTNLSNLSCGIQTTTINQLKNIQFKKIPSIESFNYVQSNINNNNNNFGKLRNNNSEDINNLTDKEHNQTTKIKNNMERRRNTLDRLQDQIRLNFGRRSSPSPTQQEKQRKSAKKSEKLRELTELLRGTTSSAASSTSSQSNRFSPTPPPIPPPRKPRHGSQQSSFDKSNEKLPPDPGPPPSPISPLRAADSEDILLMDQEVEDEPHRYSAPQLRSTSSSTTADVIDSSTIITESPSSPPLPPPPPPLPPQPLFSTQTLNTKIKYKKNNKDEKIAATTTHEHSENNKSTLMSTLRPNSSVSNLEAFIFGRGGRGKSKSPPPYVTLTKSISKDESTATEDDICTSLPKPESRTVIGSYNQKSIPKRSQSFSQIDYSSGKYVKSAFNAFRERFRKSQDKNHNDSVVDNSNLTLPRKKDDRDISSEENKPKEPDFIYIPLKKSELNINLRYDDTDKPMTLEDRVNPPEIIMEEDSQMSELDSPMRTEQDCSPDMSEASDSVIVPTTILEDKSDENHNKMYPKSSPIEVSREGSAKSDSVNSNEKDLLMESPPDNMKTSTACLIPIPVYESTESPMTGSRENISNVDSRSVEAIPTVLNQEENIFVEEPLDTYDNTGSPDNLPRISVSQNTPQGSIDEGGETPSPTAEINPARLSVEQNFDDQPVLPIPVEEVLTRPIEFTEVKKRYSNDAIIGDRSHSADSILSRGGSSEEKRKRDKSKRRMGLYFQWPAVETPEAIATDPEWTPSIETSSFEEKRNIPLDITKVDFSTLKSGNSQNENLSLFLNDAINQPETISSTQTPESIATYDTSTPESDSNSKPKMWSRFNRRTSLTCQSSEEKDDVPSPAPSSHRSNRNLLCFKNDSTSDNESDRTPPPSRDRTSPSPAPGDNDFKRYSKRPLRGPYGQMLEAEMKKPGKVHYDEIFEELKENDSLGKIQSHRTRSQSNRSFDETRTIPQHSNSMRVRKTANLPIPVHTRAASTPSQMESVAGSPSSGNNRINPKDTAGSFDNSKNKDTSQKKYSSSDIQRDRSPKRASSEAPDMKLLNHAKRSPSSSSDRHNFLKDDKAPKRSFEEMRFSQSSRTNSERSTISESNKSIGGVGVSSNVSNSSILVPSPELLAALLKGSSERQVSEQRQQTIVDTRNHIVEEIYRTEASYVDALTTIVTKYYNVLKTSEYAGLIDTKAVDEIFYMTNELLSIHKKFYNDLKLKSDPSLDPTLCCESFLETFSKTEVLETYTCFVNNRCRAHEAVKTAIQARPAFGKFLESTAREQKGKLSLDNLLIKPIQKFVNYEMLFTRLLKHTDSDIDQKPIQDVLKLVHDILLHLDCKKKEINENGQREDTLRQYETYIEGISDLVVPERQFLLYDLVQLPSNHTSNHMRGLFLFSDLLVITSIKRRSGAIKKQDFRSNSSTLDVNFAATLENIKYKFLRKFPLEYVEIVKTQDENARRIVKDYEQLIDDRSKIQQIDQIQTSIKFQSTLHQVLEQTVRNYLSEVESRLTECERQLNDGQLNSLKFIINIPGDSTQLTVLFGKAEKRAKCEEIFNDAKQKLAACLERHPTPEFLRSIALRKTRAGLQFTCAAPTLTDQKDVWVCNSDGYIGQVAVLSIQENPPTVSSCNGVCNARILCIASVPAYKETKPQSRQSSTEEAPQSCRNSSSSDNSKKTSSSTITTSAATTTTTVKDSVGGVSTGGGDINEIQLDSNSSSDDSDPEQLSNMATIPEGSSNGSGNGVGVNVDTNSSNLNQENRISSPISKTVSSMSNLSTIHHQHQDSNSDDSECQQSTMWLGTEDGCIHVYNSTDNIRIKKNKIKIEHSSAVYSILYFDNKVFVSLANGDICVYLRDNVGWNTSHPLCISIGTVTSPVTKLLNVNGKLWCSIQGTIKVLDTKSLQVESTIQISTDSKPITNMAICNNCVWISIQNSAIIKCFHSTSHELIFEVNLAPSVNKMLSNCDDIIRQHKAACLRVTSLLACKDLIWIGTSAGVLLTIPAQCYIKGQTNITPIVTGIPHGHTGHVRFLTSVESNSITGNGTNPTTTTLLSSSSTLLSSTISDNQQQQLDITNTQGSNNSYNINYNNNINNNNNSISSSNSGNNSNNRSGSRTRSEIGSSNNLNSNSNINITTTSKYSSKSVDSSLDRKSKRNALHHNKNKTKNDTGKILIISGGDGYENFGNTNANSPSEIAGREDSTNHLLLWQI